MTTIYAFLNPNEPVKKGIVEIIDIHSGSYGNLAVDGKIIKDVYKTSFSTEVAKSSFIKKCVKISGVPEDQLTFIYYDFYYYAYDILAQQGKDYESTDYDTYNKILKFYKNNSQTTIKNTYKFIGVGIEELEENFC